MHVGSNGSLRFANELYLKMKPVTFLFRNTMNVGAVAALRNIKDAIAVAKHVLENTKHTLLAGDQATEFAIMMGFKRESLTTPTSKSVWREWQRNSCQPNFWTVRNNTGSL